MKSRDQSMNVPTLAIIILNWNGWEDTCECLASLIESSFQDFRIILIDNGSTDDSIDRIKLWANGGFPISVGPFESTPKKYTIPFTEHTLDKIEKYNGFLKSNNNKIIMISSPENLGFAKGCNVGIRYAMNSGIPNTLLLNNDTTLDMECLNYLVQSLENQPEYDVATPMIFYYNRPKVIWYFGGKLTLSGRRKYYYFNKNIKENKIVKFKDISFVSGCALFARTKIFERFGLLSEKFFFGEEDYNFSLRMRENEVKMIAVSSAKLYHKKGATHAKMFSQNKLPCVFIGYLNRFIDKKIQCRFTFYWKIWRFVCLGYIVPKLIFINHYPLHKVIQLTQLLIQTTNTRNDVDIDIFNQAKTLSEMK